MDIGNWLKAFLLFITSQLTHPWSTIHPLNGSRMKQECYLIIHVKVFYVAHTKRGEFIKNISWLAFNFSGLDFVLVNLNK